MPKSKKAFTLIEVLLVLILIGVLVTTMYPSFEGVRLKARLKEVPNSAQLIAAAEKYYQFKTGRYAVTAPNLTDDNYVGTIKLADPLTGGTISTLPNTSFEEILNIELPNPGTDSLCKYGFNFQNPDGFYVQVTEAGNNTWLAEYYTEDGFGQDNFWKINQNHRLAPYLLYLE